jgi:hypothetical protein
MLKDVLTLTGVTVDRITETSDGMGGMTTTTLTTTLTRCQIWQGGGRTSFISDKMANASTHLMAIETGEYTFSDADQYVKNGSVTYKLTGHADDVAHQGEITVIGLERIT